MTFHDNYCGLSDLPENELISIFNAIKLHNAWTQTDGRTGKKADLSNMNLAHIDFTNNNFCPSYNNICLEGSNLSYANFKHTSLLCANLKNATLEKTNFYGADLVGANMSGANLKSANLIHANLRDANLRDANLRDANLRDVDFWDADLRGVKFDKGILKCDELRGTKWLSTDIPWYLQHPGYVDWGDTIIILDE